MIGLLQRVRQASVTIDDSVVAAIGPGLLVFVAVRQGDSDVEAARLTERILTYRVFPDDKGRMNRSLVDLGYGLLLVPQFTLAADTHKGRRASFTGAAAPEEGRRLFEYMFALCRERVAEAASGVFGAHMQVGLINDGPVTFWLES